MPVKLRPGQPALRMLAWVLPGILLPMLLVDAFNWLSQRDTYRAFFLAAAGLAALLRSAGF